MSRCFRSRKYGAWQGNTARRREKRGEDAGHGCPRDASSHARVPSLPAPMHGGERTGVAERDRHLRFFFPFLRRPGVRKSCCRAREIQPSRTLLSAHCILYLRICTHVFKITTSRVENHVKIAVLEGDESVITRLVMLPVEGSHFNLQHEGVLRQASEGGASCSGMTAAHSIVRS